jgi:hypothetical protein
MGSFKSSIPLEGEFEIKVGAHTFFVKYVDSGNNWLGDDNHGVYVGHIYTIFINDSDPDSIKLSTFFHELMHALEELYDLKMSHRDLNVLGEVFSQVLIDNFQLKITKKGK